METKTSNVSLRPILIVIAIGIWTLVLQIGNVIPTSHNVYVENAVNTHVLDGKIDADVSGTVSVDNKVDVNLWGINGSSRVFYRDTDGMYNLIGITVRE
ncbi:MAG: hypothetical protein ACM3RX_06280 [Methanococcaceae archaeon]